MLSNRIFFLCIIISSCNAQRRNNHDDLPEDHKNPGISASPFDGGDVETYLRSIAMTEDEIKVLPPAWFGIWSLKGRGLDAKPGGTTAAPEFGTLQVGYRYHSLTFYIAAERDPINVQIANRFQIVNFEETKIGEGKISLRNQLDKKATDLNAIASPFHINCLYRFQSPEDKPSTRLLQLRCGEKDQDFPTTFDEETLNFGSRVLGENVTHSETMGSPKNTSSDILTFATKVDKDYSLSNPQHQFGITVAFSGHADVLTGKVISPSGKEVSFATNRELDYAKLTEARLGLGAFPMSWDPIKGESTTGLWRIELSRPSTITDDAIWRATRVTLNFYDEKNEAALGTIVRDFVTQENPRITTRSLIPLRPTVGRFNSSCSDKARSKCDVEGDFVVKAKIKAKGLTGEPTIHVKAHYSDKKATADGDTRNFYYEVAGDFNAAYATFVDGYGIYEFFDKIFGQKGAYKQEMSLDSAGFSSVTATGTPSTVKKLEFLFYQYDIPVWMQVESL